MTSSPPGGRQTAAQRGYGYRWQKVRATWLGRPENACCVMCRREGRDVPATVIDHIIPHRGDQALFWDKGNWQPLCKPHHDRDKRLEEMGAHTRDGGRGVDRAGRPIDPRHPWNRCR